MYSFYFVIIDLKIIIVIIEVRNYILGYFFEYLWSFRLNRFVLKLPFIKMLSNIPSISNMKILITHYVKSVPIRSYFWFVFSRIRTEYGEILSRIRT